MIITIEVLDHPSNSKGWARYASDQCGRPLTKSTTGNPWVGKTTKSADAAGGEFSITSQVMLREGRAKKERIYTARYFMETAEGEVAEVKHSPGSQGQTLRVRNARLLREE